MREIVVDTETTGLSPAEGHRILEIAAVAMAYQVLTGEIFHRLINPERDVPEDAVRVHGNSAAVLASKPVFADVVDEFLFFIGDARLVIHNAEFDMGFINAELARIGREPIPATRVVDTLAIARRKHPGQSNSLDALCDRYRIDRSRRVKHGALIDAEILAEIYGELVGGRQRSLSFSEIRMINRPSRAACLRRLDPRVPRAPLIEVDEALAHLKHIETFGESAIWLQYGSKHTVNA